MLFKQYEIEKDLKRKYLADIYFLYGENDYSKNEIKDKIIETFYEINNINKNIQKFDGDRFDFDDFKFKYLSRNIFDSKKIIIIDNFDKINISIKTKVVDLLINKNYIKNKLVIILAGVINSNTKIYKLLIDESYAVCFWPLFDNQIPEWIIKRASVYNKTINQEAANLLFQKIGNNLNVIDSELNKLSIFVGNNKTITIENIRNYVELTKIYSVFDLLKPLSERNKKAAIFVYKQLLKNGENLNLIVASMIKNFIKLLKIKLLKNKNISIDDISKIIGTNKKYIDEIINQVSLFEVSTLIDIISDITDIDKQLKSSGQNVELKLLEIIDKYCN